MLGLAAKSGNSLRILINRFMYICRTPIIAPKAFRQQVHQPPFRALSMQAYTAVNVQPGD